MLTAIPNRPRAQTANTLLSNVSAFLPHRLIPQPLQQGAPPAERGAERGRQSILINTTKEYHQNYSVSRSNWSWENLEETNEKNIKAKENYIFIIKHNWTFLSTLHKRNYLKHWEKIYLIMFLNQWSNLYCSLDKIQTLISGENGDKYRKNNSLKELLFHCFILIHICYRWWGNVRNKNDCHIDFLPLSWERNLGKIPSPSNLSLEFKLPHWARPKA